MFLSSNGFILHLFHLNIVENNNFFTAIYTKRFQNVEIKFYPI